jgi:eukaryotic-like serine/threonine-protein kinase
VLLAALPRAGWLTLTVVMAGSLSVDSNPGGSVSLLAGGLIPVLLSPRDGPAWPLAAGAPLLAALGLAVAWPAIAGMAGRLHRRAALAATGWAWVGWVGTQTNPQGIASNLTLHDAVHHVFTPLLRTGTLASCAVWALAALMLPWTRTPRSPQLEYLRLAAWATVLALATVAASRLGTAGGSVSAGTALAGAYAGAVVALVTRRLVRRVNGHQNGNDPAPTS